MNSLVFPLFCPSPVHCRFDNSLFCLFHINMKRRIMCKDTSENLRFTNHKFSYVRDGPFSAVAINRIISQKIPSVVDTTALYTFCDAMKITACTTDVS